MKVTLADGTVHRFEILGKNDLYNDEITDVEKAIGITVDHWSGDAGMSLITGMVWISLRRDNPDLQFKDVRFKLADLDTGDEDADTEPGKGDLAPEEDSSTSTTSTSRRSRTTSGSARGRSGS